METSNLQTDIGHKIGDNNVEKFGLDVHNPVFAISAILVVSLVIGTLAFREVAADVFGDLRTWITTTFDWFFILTVNIFVIFCFAVAFSPLGRVRLGGNKAKPKFIDARRHPLSCCFSGFKQLFGQGQEFSYGLERIGDYYREYVELMAHWEQVRQPIYRSGLEQWRHYEPWLEPLKQALGPKLSKHE